jgi:hypothetical protein
VSEIPGVERALFDIENGNLIVEYDDLRVILEQITESLREFGCDLTVSREICQYSYSLRTGLRSGNNQGLF